MCNSVKISENVAWPIKALNASSDRNRCVCGWSLTALSRQNYKALLFCLLVIPCFRERVLFHRWIRSPLHPQGVTPDLCVCLCVWRKSLSLLRYRRIVTVYYCLSCFGWSLAMSCVHCLCRWGDNNPCVYVHQCPCLLNTVVCAWAGCRSECVSNQTIALSTVHCFKQWFSTLLIQRPPWNHFVVPEMSSFCMLFD